jgi:hypothetical protein
MIPILYKLDPDTPLKQAIVYLIAFLVVLYAAWSGWQGAHGPFNPKTREFDPPTAKQRMNRALAFAVGGTIGCSRPPPSSAARARGFRFTPMG